jgi:D-alanyl-D-alanine carboxypeptidase
VRYIPAACILAALLGWAGPLPAADPLDPIAFRIDELFKSVTPGKSPGAAVAVVRNGRAIVTRCYGMADVEKDVPITPATIFRLASVTKPFTAIAVLQLAERGKLSIDDAVSKYLPEFAHGATVRISHLLSHTAGIADFISYDEALKRPLEFEPGSRINYSNSGYQLLGRVIEKVSGMSYEDYLRKHIFSPLGMRNSGYDKTEVLPGRATPFLLDKDGYYKPVRAQDAAGAYAAGGLYSTILDMVQFEQGLTSGTLLRKPTLERASTNAIVAGGRKIAYGQGWMTRNHRGLREAGHGGDITGFNTYIARYPEHGLAVIVLSNTGMQPPGPLPAAGDLAHSIAELYLGDRMEKSGTRPTVRVAVETLDRYCGTYKVEAPAVVLRNLGEVMTISRDGDRLTAAVGPLKLPLEAYSDVTFQATGSPAELTFTPGANESKAASFMISLLGLREFRAVRVD